MNRYLANWRSHLKWNLAFDTSKRTRPVLVSYCLLPVPNFQVVEVQFRGQRLTCSLTTLGPTTRCANDLGFRYKRTPSALVSRCLLPRQTWKKRWSNSTVSFQRHLGQRVGGRMKLQDTIFVYDPSNGVFGFLNMLGHSYL